MIRHYLLVAARNLLRHPAYTLINIAGLGARAEAGPSGDRSLRPDAGYGIAWLIIQGDTRFYERKVIWAEAPLLDLFAIPLVAGNPRTALTEPYSVVISEEMASKYFGEEDALGKVLNGDNRWDFKVTGIMRNIPTNSHLRRT